MPHVETYIDGVWYPSVTTVLGSKPKPWLDKWREKWGVLAERKTAVANAIGSDFHTGAELFLSRETHFPKYPRVEAMLREFRTWAVSVDGVVDHTELKVISRKYQYSGTLDAVGTLDGMPTLFDWKTSSAIYADMALQLVAYAQAYYEHTGVWCKRGIIVHVSKDKPHHKLTVKEYPLNKRLLNKFLKRLKEFREYNDPVKGAA